MVVSNISKRLKSPHLPPLIVVIILAAFGGYLFLKNFLHTDILPSLFEQLVSGIPNSPFVSAKGTKLYLNGQSYVFTGINAFNLGTMPGVNAGCGSPVSDIDTFFSQLRPGSVVRLWAFQGSMTTNVNTKELDWRGLDRVINAAQTHQMKLILTLGNQDGTCDDGHWKDKNWYQGGYKTVTNDFGNGLTPLSYLEYVKQVVSRYQDSTAIAMWEPINEPEASDCQGKGNECYNKKSCPDEKAASEALRGFFDIVGGEIKAIAPHHLVSSGVIGSGQCGTSADHYAFLHQSTGIDIASYHDYGSDDLAMPGDQWNGLSIRIDQMKQIDKPLIIGESGIKAKDGGQECISLAQRAEKFKIKMDAQFKAGISGFLPWAITGGVSQVCNYDIGQNDPTLSLLKDYPVTMNNAAIQSSPPVVEYTFNAPPSPFKPSPSPDLVPPTAPHNLKLISNLSNQVVIQWESSTDSTGVVRYDIFKDGAYYSSTEDIQISISGLQGGHEYHFTVKGKDAAGNNSAPSDTLTVKTPTS